MDTSNDSLVLAELLNHVLDKGVVLQGEIVISVADVDLIKLGLSLYLSAVERRESMSGSREEGGTRRSLPSPEK